MTDIAVDNIVKCRYRSKYGRITKVLDIGYDVEWFGGDCFNPCLFWEIELFCNGNFMETCDKCCVRFQCYTTRGHTT